MKKNQLILSAVMLFVTLFFNECKQKTDTTTQGTTEQVATDTTSTVGKTSTTTSRESQTVAMGDKLINYQFRLVDNFTHRNYTVWVSLNGGTPVQLITTGVSCNGTTQSDGFTYVPITITCPVAPAKTPVLIEITLKNAAGVVVPPVKSTTDHIASCDIHNILTSPPFGTPCGMSIRTFPADNTVNPPIPGSTTITVTVSEPNSNEVYEQVVSWPPSLR